MCILLVLITQTNLQVKSSLGCNSKTKYMKTTYCKIVLLFCYGNSLLNFV